VGTSRSAAVRLAPVRAALADLGVVQAVVGAGARDARQPPRTLAAAADADAVRRALRESRPRLVVVAGDGDAAVDAALVATEAGVRVARLGAGLRCGDITRRCETNRIVLDELSDLLLTDGEGASERLRAEGFETGRMTCVGNPLAAAALTWRGAAERLAVPSGLGVPCGGYVLVALDDPDSFGADVRLARITEALAALARRTAVVLCVDEPMRVAMRAMGDLVRLRLAGVVVTGRLEYLEFLSLQAGASAVVTDSSGVQEETTVLGVPCFTLARSSERTLTLTHGTNVLLGDEPEAIANLSLPPLPCLVDPIPLWDGAAGRRVATLLAAA
jgi:UDP-N-acetylglucosamine 2-epimerase (non-hydrolysing)